MTCFVLEIYDPPLAPTFSPQSVIGQDTSQSVGTEVLIIGAHECSGRQGILRSPAEFNDSGIRSCTVELRPNNEKMVVDMANVIPW